MVQEGVPQLADYHPEIPNMRVEHKTTEVQHKTRAITTFKVTAYYHKINGVQNATSKQAK